MHLHQLTRPAKGTIVLGMTGEELVAELSTEGDPIGVWFLIWEASRIADRLAKLDALLSGDVSTWTRVVMARDQMLEVRVDSAL